MKVTEHIESLTNQRSLSIEIIPPLKGGNIDDIYNTLYPIMEFSPAFVNVTYHGEECEYKELANGFWQRRVLRKRPGTVGICAAIQNKFKVDAVPHLLCGGFTKEQTENLLIDLNYLGIENVVALRGDAPKGELYFRAKEDGHPYASHLVKQIENLNRGIYLDEELENSAQSDFCIGVAGYPEKHSEAANLDSDIEYLKEKVDNGASYIITQLFYDNSKFFAFVDKCRAAGITIPIIPGLKPFATKRQLHIIPQRFHVDLPTDLAVEVTKAASKEAVREVGTEWMIAQSKELFEAGFHLIHYYTMGRTEGLCRLAKTLL